jgi:uncharacterized protein (UPF0264 family)
MRPEQLDSLRIDVARVFGQASAPCAPHLLVELAVALRDADRLLKHGGENALRCLLDQLQREGASNAAAGDVESVHLQVVEQVELVTLEGIDLQDFYF